MTFENGADTGRWSIERHRSGHALNDRDTGKRVSWHRTISGALRARRELIEERDGVVIPTRVPGRPIPPIGVEVTP